MSNAKRNSKSTPRLLGSYKIILSAKAAIHPKAAAPRHTPVCFEAAAVELLVPMTFPFKPQFEPKHGKVDTAVVMVAELVIKNPCWS
jgi:hypothetical protein